MDRQDGQDRQDGNLAATYARLLQDPDPAVHEPAARAWCAWEDITWPPSPGINRTLGTRTPGSGCALPRLVTHYWSNAHFLPEGSLVRHADRLAGIPVVMINGQLDISSPLDTAWSLHTAIPGSELIVIGDGHGGGQSRYDAVTFTTDRLARRRAS